MPFAQRQVPVFQLNRFFFAAGLVAQEKFVVNAGVAAVPAIDGAVFLGADDRAAKDGDGAAIAFFVLERQGAAHGVVNIQAGGYGFA